MPAHRDPVGEKSKRPSRATSPLLCWRQHGPGRTAGTSAWGGDSPGHLVDPGGEALSPVAYPFVPGAVGRHQRRTHAKPSGILDHPRGGTRRRSARSHADTRTLRVSKMTCTSSAQRCAHNKQERERERDKEACGAGGPRRRVYAEWPPRRGGACLAHPQHPCPPTTRSVDTRADPRALHPEELPPTRRTTASPSLVGPRWRHSKRQRRRCSSPGRRRQIGEGSRLTGRAAMWTAPVACARVGGKAMRLPQ